MYLHSQRGRAALSRAAAEPERKDHFIAAAHKNAGKITRAGMAYSRPLAELLHAGAAQSQGKVQDAIRYLEQSETGFSATGMSLHAAVCRLRHGTLLGTEEGRVLTADAEAYLRKQQIANVPRFTAMLAPGFDPQSNS